MGIFNTYIYEPIFNLLIWLYNILPGHDIGLAIIVMTVLVRLAFFPLSRKSIESQKALQDLQPKIEDLKKKYKDNKEKLGQEMMRLYKENKVNPASSCLPLLIQLPFLWAIYRVFAAGLTNGSLDIIYPFIHNPGTINTVSFGFIDLAQRQWVLAVLAALAQFWQAKMLSTKKPPVKSDGAKDEAFASIMNKQMIYVLPLFTLWIGLKFPGGLTLYWLITTLLTALQQLLIFKKQEDNEKIND